MILVILIPVLLIIFTILFKSQINGLASDYLIVKILKYIIVLVSVAFIALLSCMGIGEILSGDLTGITHLIPAILLLIFSFLLLLTGK